MKISLVALTFNRAETVARAVAHNLATSGRPIDELIWVDNGSTDNVRDVMSAFRPDVIVLNKTNLGVSRGYNRGFALATGDYIVQTDCDMLMPENWLATFERCLNDIPSTGVVAMFSVPIISVRERIRGPETRVAGLRIQPALPLGQRIVSRELLTRQIGYLRQDFGLYGWGDVEWAERAYYICWQKGLSCYALLDHIPRHLGDQDPPEYRQWKLDMAQKESSKALVRRCQELRWPYYSPY